ncbi:MAG: hypothetical protein IJ403_00670 [Oscillospiraceae bacterium]|nr:hypothetical protein [Oscillospiraceae bacterium]
MENKKNAARFVIDFANKKIIGTKASFDKAGKGIGDIYTELATKIAAHPEFTLEVKEQKSRSNKVKQTYHGLNFELMEKFIKIQPNEKSLMQAYNAAKKMAEDTGTNKYPFVKKWFLGQFKDFDVAKAKKAISDYYVSKVDQNATTTHSGETDVAEAA